AGGPRGGDGGQPRIGGQPVEVGGAAVADRSHSQVRRFDAGQPECRFARDAARMLVVDPAEGDPHQAAPWWWMAAARLTKASTKVDAICPKTGASARPSSPPAISYSRVNSTLQACGESSWNCQRPRKRRNGPSTRSMSIVLGRSWVLRVVNDCRIPLKRMPTVAIMPPSIRSTSVDGHQGRKPG